MSNGDQQRWFGRDLVECWGEDGERPRDSLGARCQCFMKKGDQDLFCKIPTTV